MFSDNQVLFNPEYKHVSLSNTDFKHIKMIKGTFYYCNLSNSNLAFTSFYNVCFRGVHFTESDLSNADFIGCDFTLSTFNQTNLVYSSFEGCKFLDSFFDNCDLDLCFLARNNYTRIELKDTTINWNCHDLIGEILRQEAGNDKEKIKVAGYITIQKRLCWRNFLSIDDPLKEWAIDVLAKMPGAPIS
jgi:uncharacterized protein YjbI with pentapeptide repeats